MLSLFRESVTKKPYAAPLLFAVGFFIIIEALFLHPSFFIWFLAIILNTWLFYLLYKKPHLLILPTLFLASIWCGLSVFLTTPLLIRNSTIVVFAAIYFLIHLDFRMFHRSDFFNKDLFYLLNFVVMLLWANSLFILVDFDKLSYLAILFLAALCGGATALNLFHSYKKEQKILFLVFALISGEIFWLMTFWPFFYLTSAAVFVILYYSFWVFSIRYLENIISIQFLLRIFLAASILISGLFILTPWSPL